MKYFHPTNKRSKNIAYLKASVKPLKNCFWRDHIQWKTEENTVLRREGFSSDDDED
jgi:hypothetical protein